MENLQKYFTFKINGVKYVPTIEDRKYTYRLFYDTAYNLNISYPIIKDENLKVVKDSIKENMKRKLKEYEIELRRKELFGV
nr:MAG TPA: hypothetical protein [Caudoviricetes sp.]